MEELLLKFLTFDELAKLNPDVHHHLQQFVFRLADFSIENFHNTMDVLSSAYDEPQRASKPRLARHLRPRKVRIGEHIGDPYGLRGTPHSAG